MKYASCTPSLSNGEIEVDQISDQDRPTATRDNAPQDGGPSDGDPQRQPVPSSAPSSTTSSKAGASTKGKKPSAKPAAKKSTGATKHPPHHIGVKIADPNLIKQLDTYSIEDIVELKIARFLDQLGGFYPENMHELIMCKVEKPLIVQILRHVGGNQVHAAKVLGINRNTLRKKMKLYSIGL